MKVLFVYKYLTLGGVEAVLRARLDGLERLGIEAHCWFFQDYGGRPIFSGREDRVRVGPVEACLRCVRKEGFDLLCSLDTEEILPGLSRMAKPPRLVYECHSTYDQALERLSLLAAHPPAAVFAPSQEQQRIVRERLGEGIEVRVVPNPLRQEFVSEPEAFPSPPPRPVLAWIGRLDAQKNWKGFLTLAGILARRGIPMEPWIIGKPVAGGADVVLRRAREEQVLGGLRWFYTVPSGRMPIILDAVRDSGGALVSTSRGESFGLTVAEAMARRCAVVVPDQPPFTELVEEGETGCLFKPGSPVAAARRLQEVLASPCLRREYGRRGREKVLARFAPEPALAALARELERVAAA